MPARPKSNRKPKLSQSAAQRALRELVERQGPSGVAERQGVTVRTIQRWASKGPPASRLDGIGAAFGRSEGARKAALTRAVPRVRQRLAEAAVDHSQARALYNKGLIDDRAYNRVARHFERTFQQLERNKREGGQLLERVRALELVGRELIGADEVADDFDLSSVKQVYTLYFSGP